MNKVRLGLRENLAHNLLMMRTIRGETQESVGKAIGVSTNRISGWERGLNEPMSTHLYLIARYYGVPTEFLFEDWVNILRRFNGILDKEGS